MEKTCSHLRLSKFQVGYAIFPLLPLPLKLLISPTNIPTLGIVTYLPYCMEKISITIIKNDQKNKFSARKGENLRGALLRAGYSPYTKLSENLNCGGRGLCATCGVFIVKNPPKPTHWHDWLAKKFHYPRLSCQITLIEDLTIVLPDKIIWGKPNKNLNIK